MMTKITVRSATAADVGTILRFVKGLAAFEHEPDAVKATEADLLRDGFGPQPKFEVLIAEAEQEPVGFALFFPTYSTWEGRPGVHLEDIFVVEQMRGQGVGQALVTRLAAIAVERIAFAVMATAFLMFEVWFKVPLFKGALQPLRFLGY